MYLFPIHITEVVLCICNIVRLFFTFCISSRGYYNFLNNFIFTLCTWRFLWVLWISRDMDKSIRSFFHPCNIEWNHFTALKLSCASPIHPSTPPSLMASTDHHRPDALLFWSHVLSHACLFPFLLLLLNSCFHQIILIPCHNVEQVTCAQKL